MTTRFVVGDVFEVMATIPDGTVDLMLTSPPFLSLRSYLPADHPDKGKEIGSESTPAEYLDTLLELTAEFGRVLAPHGSIAVELGDTYAGSGGAGVARRFWDNWIPFDDRTPPVWVTPYEPDEPMTEVERAALDALRARDHVDREESE